MLAARTRSPQLASTGLGGGRARALVARSGKPLAKYGRRAQRVVLGVQNARARGHLLLQDEYGSRSCKLLRYGTVALG